jgi:predicted 2-oxoglutarate/Fe(II)-dependent dioxygenase YbiX
VGHLLQLDDVLGETRRRHLIAAVAGEADAWGRSDSLGHTGHGAGARQLAPDAGHYRSPQMTTVRIVMASICYAATADHFDLPAPERLEPQVFPVRMRGSLTDPPHQDPHVDGRDGVPPIVTAVYYADVQETDGGQLAVGQPPNRQLITPTTDMLVAFPGDTVHEVLGLLAGYRVSVVCNLYAADN